MMKKVAIFTTFYEFESGYSLIAVAETQVRQLLKNGYDPVVIVRDGYDPPTSPDSIWTSHMVKLRATLPNFHHKGELLPEYEGLESQITGIVKGLTEALEDVEVVLTHDIILQKHYLAHNIALRRYAATRPDILWLHWLHSCPTPASRAFPAIEDWSNQNAPGYPDSCRYLPPPGYIIYPNSVDQNLVSKTYGVPMEKIKSCRASHAIDPLHYFHCSSLTRHLVQRADLLNGDFVAIYPVRMDRGKQVEKILELLAGVFKAGYEPRLLVVAWQSSGVEKQKYIDEMIDLSNQLELEGKVFFTNRLHDSASEGLPPKMVRELVQFGNIYIHPSRIETYSLVVHEAMLAGNLVVLNHDLPPMRELFGDNAIYMDFESDRVSRTYGPDFWDEEAKRLIAEFFSNRSLVARSHAIKNWRPERMWREFERLFYLPI
jgi:hypothetical protein